MAERVFLFVRALDRLNVTSLLTIPKPVSRLACRLKSSLEKVVPIAIMLSSDPQTGKSGWLVTKYLGEPKLSTHRVCRIHSRAHRIGYAGN